jgi:hypothetical protein
LGVYDLKVAKLVEQITFKGLSLASPTAHTADKLLDADPVAHSIGVYKGKVFLLVSFNKFTVAITHFDMVGPRTIGCGHFANMGRPCSHWCKTAIS